MKDAYGEWQTNARRNTSVNTSWGNIKLTQYQTGQIL